MFRFKNRKKRENSALEISVERLESRLMLAANVVVSGANVTITGSADPDTVLLTADLGGNLQVSDGTVNQPTGLSNIGTLTINTLGGVLDTITLNIAPASGISISNLNINSGEGNDVIRLDNANVTGSSVMNTAGGDDIVLTGVGGAFNLNQNLTVNTGSGFDRVILGGNVGNNVVVSTGTDNSLVLLNSTSVLNVGGNVTVTGGAGVDRVFAGVGAVTNIAGNLTITTLGGNDQVSAGVNANVNVGDNLRQDTGLGNDVNLVGGTGATAIGGTLDVVDAAGNNPLIRIQNTTVIGNANVLAGTGIDNIQFTGANNFGANLVIRANAGNDVVNFAGGLASVNMVNGYSRLTVDGGAGTDVLTGPLVFGLPFGAALDFLGATVQNFT